MTTLDSTTVKAVQATLDDVFPDGRHWPILELLAVVGCADALQLRQVTDLSRDQLALVLDKLQQAVPGLPAVFFHPRDRVTRPGQRGAPPKVYCLGETGAALLRARGQAEAHPCHLDEAVDIAHALAVLEVRLLAQHAGLPVQTEKCLPPSDATPYLRPDNLVTLPDGVLALYEIEQLLTAQHIARALQSLQNKQRFFQSRAGQDVSADVRVLFNLPSGKDYDRTLKVWRQAARVVAQRHGGRLAFRLLAMPLGHFSAAPDWGNPPQAQRWQDLTTAPEPEPAPAASAAAPNSPPAKPGASLAEKTPQALRRYTGHESALVLNALWSVFREGAGAHLGTAQRADPALFEIVGVIYAASHDPSLTPLERAGYPHASLYLLKQYLRLHQTLYKRLRQEILRGAQAMRWNTITITHRMQVVCQHFLHYHGFGTDGLMLVRALSADWNAAEPQTFRIQVDVFDTAVVCEGVDAATARELTQGAEQTLAWVLTALFTYAEDLGLPRAPFW